MSSTTIRQDTKQKDGVYRQYPLLAQNIIQTWKGDAALRAKFRGDVVAYAEFRERQAGGLN